ncbi:hypothetical protein CCP3SC1AL1_980011 [Gammaproteobacteria bacterium]
MEVILTALSKLSWHLFQDSHNSEKKAGELADPKFSSILEVTQLNLQVIDFVRFLVF